MKVEIRNNQVCYITEEIKVVSSEIIQQKIKDAQAIIADQNNVIKGLKKELSTVQRLEKKIK